MLGFTVSLVPQYGYSGLSSVLNFGVGSLFANAGVDFDVDDLVNSLLSGHKIQGLVTKNEVDIVMLTQASIKKTSIFTFELIKEITKGDKNLTQFIY